jgi:hypothetical protein
LTKTPLSFPNSTSVGLVLLVTLCLPAGCRLGARPDDHDAAVRHQTRAKLHNGMTQAEVDQTLGRRPSEFRPGGGRRDDVALYPVGDETYTLYFYQGRLTRVVSSRKPVNR